MGSRYRCLVFKIVSMFYFVIFIRGKNMYDMDIFWLWFFVLFFFLLVCIFLFLFLDSEFWEGWII